jgi:hypothetical protein
VAALPDAAWSDNDLASVAATADAHEAGLRLALLGVAARRGAEAARVALLEEAKAGSLDAVAALADVRDVPRDVVVAQIGRLAESVIRMVTDARAGKHGLPHRDPAHALILLNIWHPDDAVWEPVLDLLQEPAVVASNKRLALRLLVQTTERIPEAVGVQLAQIAASLARSSGSAPLDFFGGGSVSGQAALLAVALDALSTEETAHHLIRLLSGDRADRLMAATLAGREPKADHTGILAALAGDEVPDVRAAAAEALARRLAGGDDSDLLIQALRAGLDDPGTLMASAIAATLAMPPNRLRWSSASVCAPAPRPTSGRSPPPDPRATDDRPTSALQSTATSPASSASPGLRGSSLNPPRGTGGAGPEASASRAAELLGRRLAARR